MGVALWTGSGVDSRRGANPEPPAVAGIGSGTGNASGAIPLVGLEPSCLLTFRDEALVLCNKTVPRPSTPPAGGTLAGAPAIPCNGIARQLPSGRRPHRRSPLGLERGSGGARFLLFEEFVAEAAAEGDLALPLHPLAQKRALLHGHCHQKAFGAMSAVERTLRLVPELAVETVASSCCGMAGAFGYEAEHYEASMAMAELGLLPAVRAADRDTLIVADGTSCRHQIAGGADREAWHVARVLERALPA